MTRLAPLTPKTILVTLLIAGTAMTLLSCSTAKIWSFISQSTAQAVKSDVIFDIENQLATDIYYTKDQAKGTVIFIYGGSWRTGSKDMYGFLADGLVKFGYNVVIPSYRLYPDAAYPEFIRDIETFMIWFDKNAEQLKLATDKRFLMGHSAGAYNAAMYLTDSQYHKPFQYDAFIGLAGPYDFFLPSSNPEYIPIFTDNGEFNNQGSLPVNQPTTDLTHLVSHAFLLHGAADKTVTPKNIDRFAKYLERCGISVQTKIYEDVGHAELVGAINNVPMVSHNIRGDLVSFLDQLTL